MHSVTNSATPDRRARTLTEIGRTAMRLADERGFDGFTMEELAEEVGVSRRTLFNYVPSKMDAVLGPEPEPDPEVFATFVAGGPTGHLVTDLKALAVTVLEAEDTDAAVLSRFRRLAKSDSRILAGVHHRFELRTQHVVDVIRQREGADFAEVKAQLAIRTLLGCFDVALDEYLARPDSTFTDHFSRVFDALVDLLR